MKSDKNFISLTNLKRDRGWSGGMIDRFLPEPDRLEPNPFYPSSYPMKLFRFSRVLEIEQLDSFKNEMKSLNDFREKRLAKIKPKLAEVILENMGVFKVHRSVLLQKVITETNDIATLILAREIVDLLIIAFPTSLELRKLKTIVISKIRRIK